MPVILISIVYAALLFFIQTMLFKKSSKKILRVIPLLMIGVVYLAALALPFVDNYMAEVGRNDGYSFYTFISLCVAGINTVGLLSTGVAWLVEKV